MGWDQGPRKFNGMGWDGIRDLENLMGWDGMGSGPGKFYGMGWDNFSHPVPSSRENKGCTVRFSRDLTVYPYGIAHGTSREGLALYRRNLNISRWSTGTGWCTACIQFPHFTRVLKAGECIRDAFTKVQASTDGCNENENRPASFTVFRCSMIQRASDVRPYTPR